MKKDIPTVGQELESGLPPIQREPPLGRQESNEDEFGSELLPTFEPTILIMKGDDFDEVDFAAPQGDEPDGVTIDPAVESEHLQRRNVVPQKDIQPANHIPSESDRSRLRSPLPRNSPAAGMFAPQIPAAIGWSVKVNNHPQNQRPPPPPFPQQPSSSASQSNEASRQQQNDHASIDHTPCLGSSNISGHEPPVGFFTARAAETLQNAHSPPLTASPFNPHLESPSIRKTAGVDHTKTQPVNRDLISAPAVPSPQQRGLNVVNPQADKARKLGMPGAASPLQNRGSYKPPHMKRSVDVGAPARLALGDVTSASINVPSGDGSGDVKRQRLGMEIGRGEARVVNI